MEVLDSTVIFFKKTVIKSIEFAEYYIIRIKYAKLAINVFHAKKLPNEQIFLFHILIVLDFYCYFFFQLVFANMYITISCKVFVIFLYFRASFRWPFIVCSGRIIAHISVLFSAVKSESWF